MLMTATMILLTTACRNKTSQETAEPAMPAIDTTWNGVTWLCESDQTLIVGIIDVENEMSIDLFRGSYNDSLLNTLMPDGATRSAINVFMAIDSANTILFDAGLGADKGGRLMECLKKDSIEPSAVTAVCLTHLHADHIGGILKLREQFPDAPIVIGKKDADKLTDSKKNLAHHFGIHLVLPRADVKLDRAYVGSCTGGKIEDFEMAARVLNGRKVAIDTFLVPATVEVAEAIRTNTIDGKTWERIFAEAGCIPVAAPGCAACLGGPVDTFGRTHGNEVVISTTNRNFIGRMGSKTAPIYLASPLTTAASAITGHITDLYIRGKAGEVMPQLLAEVRKRLAESE